MPTAPDPFIEHVRELLSGLGPVAARRMFGGWGLSVDGMNIGIVAWDTLGAFYRSGHNNRRSMAECRQRLGQMCDGTFVCPQDVNRIFAD